MDKYKSLVSICIPTYNSERYLRQCLDSIASQSYKDVEVIISDNASTDDTVCIINEYVNKAGFKLNVNPVNIGAGANFNKLISMARGEYVAIYHADDIYHETIAEESVNLLRKDPLVGLVGTMGSVIDQDGNYQYDIQLHDEIKRLNTSVYSFDESLLGAIRNMFVTPTVMVRSKAYQDVGGFDQQKYKSACDYEMWLRIARKYQVAVIDKKLIQYRVHEGQGSEQEVRRNIEAPDILWVLKEYRRYVSNEQFGAYCDTFINKGLFKTAKKQNYLGYFTKSQETLQLLNAGTYCFPKYLFKILNMLHCSAKRRSL